MAVSGGVDSMVLLHVLQKQPQLELVVAHLDHGIREDSGKDRELVQMYAMSHNLEFMYEEAKLGARASEELARKARYDFLWRICKKYNALAVVTAHHQDDLLETALINLLRGTGRRGLSALASHDQLLRPMLHLSKQEIRAYAKRHGLIWHEDSTNQEQKYLRNYVRHSLLMRADDITRKKLLSIIVRHSQLNTEIDLELDVWLSVNAQVDSDHTTLPRYSLIMLPPVVAYELLQRVFKIITGVTLEKPLAEQALLFCKTARLHKRFLLGRSWQLRIGPGSVIVEPRGNMIS